MAAAAAAAATAASPKRTAHEVREDDAAVPKTNRILRAVCDGVREVPVDVWKIVVFDYAGGPLEGVVEAIDDVQEWENHARQVRGTNYNGTAYGGSFHSPPIDTSDTYDSYVTQRHPRSVVVPLALHRHTPLGFIGYAPPNYDSIWDRDPLSAEDLRLNALVFAKKSITEAPWVFDAPFDCCDLPLAHAPTPCFLFIPSFWGPDGAARAPATELRLVSVHAKGTGTDATQEFTVHDNGMCQPFDKHAVLWFGLLLDTTPPRVGALVKGRDRQYHWYRWDVAAPAPQTCPTVVRRRHVCRDTVDPSPYRDREFRFSDMHPYGSAFLFGDQWFEAVDVRSHGSTLLITGSHSICQYDWDFELLLVVTIDPTIPRPLLGSQSNMRNRVATLRRGHPCVAMSSTLWCGDPKTLGNLTSRHWMSFVY